MDSLVTTHVDFAICGNNCKDGGVIRAEGANQLIRDRWLNSAENKVNAAAFTPALISDRCAL